jgi:hypothetical protein
LEVSLSVVALWSGSDHLLSVLAPIGVAVGRRPSLVIDLDPRGPRYASPFTLADLVQDGPTSSQLEPSKTGVSVLANGGVSIDAAGDIVGVLAQRWPNVVIRCDPATEPPESAISIVPLLPDPFIGVPRGRAVYQQLGFRVATPPGAVLLPRPSTSTLRGLTGLSSMPAQSKWLRALGKLWALA